MAEVIIEERQLGGLAIVPFVPIPYEHVVATIAVSVFFLLLTWIAVGFRFTTRIFLNASIGWDDWTMLMTLAVFTAFQSCVLATLRIIWTHSYVSSNEMGIATNFLRAAESFYVWNMIFLKVSLGIFFLRLLVETWQRRIVYTVVTISTLFGFGYFWYALFQCGVPSSDFWEQMLSHQCATSSGLVLGMGYAHAIVTAATDICLAILPIPVLRRAQIETREKVVAGAILTMAAMGCIASLIRIRYIPALENTTLTFWITIERLTIWSTVETGLGIAVASFATLRPLLRKLTSWFHGTISPNVSRLSYGSAVSTFQSTDEALNKSFNRSSGNSVTQFTGDKGNILLTKTTMDKPDSSIDPQKADAYISKNGVPSAFFLETIRSADTIDEALDRVYGSHAGEQLPPPARLEPTLNNWPLRDDTDLEMNKIPNRSNRATWWPLPRTSILEEQLDADDLLFQRHEPRRI